MYIRVCACAFVFFGCVSTGPPDRDSDYGRGGGGGGGGGGRFRDGGMGRGGSRDMRGAEHLSRSDLAAERARVKNYKRNFFL